MKGPHREFNRLQTLKKGSVFSFSFWRLWNALCLQYYSSLTAIHW